MGKGVNGNLIPPKKGEVRNPKGYPKGVPHSKTRLKRLLEITQQLTNPITGELEGFTVAEQLDLQQIIKARKGDTASYNTIMDRLEGKPQQSIAHNVSADPVAEVLKKFGFDDAGQAEDTENPTSA